MAGAPGTSRDWWFGSLPDRWVARPLKYLCIRASLYGANIPADAYEQSGVRFLRTSDIDDKGLLRSEGVYVPAELVSERMLEDMDFLISRSGTIGRAFVYRAEYGPCSYAGYLVRYVLRDTEAPRWLFYVTKSAGFEQWLGTSAIEATIGNVNGEKYANLALPVPPIGEQAAIADYLDRETSQIDVLVAAKERLVGLLVEKRRALVTHAVTRGLDPDAPLRDSGIPWLGEIPAHWEIQRAKFLFEQSALPVRDGDEIVTCFRDGEVTLRRNRRVEGFTEADLEGGYQGIRRGQLVLHSMDAFAGAIGVSDSDGKCSPEYIICDPTTEAVEDAYYGYLLRVMALAGFIIAMCPAVRERAPRIRFRNFGEMLLPVPPRKEQRAVVKAIEHEVRRIESLRNATLQTIGLLKERRSALIAAAVTGQIAFESAA